MIKSLVVIVTINERYGKCTENKDNNLIRNKWKVKILSITI